MRMKIHMKKSNVLFILIKIKLFTILTSYSKSVSGSTAKLLHTASVFKLHTKIFVAVEQ